MTNIFLLSWLKQFLYPSDGIGPKCEKVTLTNLTALLWCCIKETQIQVCNPFAARKFYAGHQACLLGHLHRPQPLKPTHGHPQWRTSLPNLLCTQCHRSVGFLLLWRAVSRLPSCSPPVPSHPGPAPALSRTLPVPRAPGVLAGQPPPKPGPATRHRHPSAPKWRPFPPPPSLSTRGDAHVTNGSSLPLPAERWRMRSKAAAARCRSRSVSRWERSAHARTRRAAVRAAAVSPAGRRRSSGSGGGLRTLRGWRRSEGSPGCCSAPPPRALCRGGACRPRPTKPEEVTGLFRGEGVVGAHGRLSLTAAALRGERGSAAEPGALGRRRRCEPGRRAVVSPGELRARDPRERGELPRLPVQNREGDSRSGEGRWV